MRLLTARALSLVWNRLPVRVRAVVMGIYPRRRFRLGVLALVRNAGGEILLLHHSFRAGLPWGLPGGWLEPGESPAEGMRRELREELGVDVAGEGLRLLAVEGRPSGSHVEVFYGVGLELDHVPPNPEFDDHGYFAPDRLPRDMHPHHRGIVQRLLAQERA